MNPTPQQPPAPSAKRIGLFLLFAFLIAWLMWGVQALLRGNPAYPLISQLISMLAMWAPAAAVRITQKLTGGGPIMGARLKPLFKGRVKWYVLAMVLPVAFTLAGAALYFVVFPQYFDGSFGMLRMQLASATSAGLPQGILPILVAVQIIASLTAAPVFNSLFAFGEEVGWRGFLYPALCQKTGPFKAHLLVGLIWGLWHTPINMMGHNYGLGYPGYPWLGILAMCLFTFGAGVFLSWLTARSGSVWPAALGHGAINAAAGLPLLCAVQRDQTGVWGPALSGIIAALPMLVFAILLALKAKPMLPTLDAPPTLIQPQMNQPNPQPPPTNY